MADEKPLENLIVVTSSVRTRNPIYLFPKADRDEIFRRFALDNVFSHIYSLSYGQTVERPKTAQGLPSPGWLPHVALTLISTRPPLDKLKFFREQLSVHWLGMASSSIDDEIFEINELLQALKAERLASRF
jgi:hypothetical protein